MRTPVHTSHGLAHLSVTAAKINTPLQICSLMWLLAFYANNGRHLAGPGLELAFHVDAGVE
jgi:hypothetical protein